MDVPRGTGSLVKPQDDPQGIISGVRSKGVMRKEGGLGSISTSATIGLWACHHRTHVQASVASHLQTSREPKWVPWLSHGLGRGYAACPRRTNQRRAWRGDHDPLGSSRLPQSEGNLGCVEQAVYTLSGREGILLHLWVCLAVPRIALIHKNFGAISMMTASLLSVKGKGTSVTLQFKAAKLKPTFRLEVGNFFLRGQITYFSH